MRQLFKTGLVVGLLLLGSGMAAHAGGSAFGKADAVIGCELDGMNGLVVNFAAMPSSGNDLDILPGDPCMTILKAFPPPFTRQ